MQGITSGETIRFPCFTVTSRQVVARKEIVNFTLSHLSHHQNQIAHNKNHRSEKKKISRPVSICGKRNRTNIPGWQTSTSQVLPDAHFCIL